MSRRQMVSFRIVQSLVSLVAGVCCAGSFVLGNMAHAQNTLLAVQQAQVDTIAQQVLTRTGEPSASIGIVQGGKTAYLKAYGKAQLEPPVMAGSSMRYSIGSISKQFTAAAILILQQQGKLSLDDTVSKWLPSLTRANEVTLREILSHTSGYQDYYAEDYSMLPMKHDTTADAILDNWGRKALDFGSARSGSTATQILSSQARLWRSSAECR